MMVEASLAGQKFSFEPRISAAAIAPEPVAVEPEPVSVVVGTLERP